MGDSFLSPETDTTPLTQWVEMTGVDTQTKEEVSGLTVYPAHTSKYGETLFAESTCRTLYTRTSVEHLTHYPDMIPG